MYFYLAYKYCGTTTVTAMHITIIPVSMPTSIKCACVCVCVGSKFMQEPFKTIQFYGKELQTKAKTLPLQKFKVKHFIENFPPKLQSHACRIDLSVCVRLCVCVCMCFCTQ